jgi:hypothetical protein
MSGAHRDSLGGQGALPPRALLYMAEYTEKPFEGVNQLWVVSVSGLPYIAR